jgi:hypothetical protein
VSEKEEDVRENEMGSKESTESCFVQFEGDPLSNLDSAKEISDEEECCFNGAEPHQEVDLNFNGR